jgi:tRNA nucleotidyltransferase (CCA-adding enzyme)
MSLEQTPSQESKHERLLALRECILNQDAELMRSANALANKIRSVPRDPKCSDVEPRAYLVGGFVRDAILGKHPKDADLEVYGISQERLEDLLHQLFGDKVVTAGKDFTVYKVNIGEDLDFDISMPRRESKSGPTRRDFKVTGDPAMSIEEASSRRDFTINSLLADPLTGEIVDSHQGIEDIENHILRMVNPKTFIEDPIRVYRALQFVARMNLTVEPKTKDLIKQMVSEGLLDTLSKEKPTEEISKLLMKSAKPSIGFELAKEIGIIERYYPELAVLEQTPQDAKHHPEGNVWIHTMMVVDESARIAKDPRLDLSETEKLELMLGALCHDLGKPSTTKEVDGHIHSFEHERAGEKPTESLLSKWKFGKEVDRSVVASVINHASPFQFIKPFQELPERIHDEKTLKSFRNSVRRMIEKIQPCSWKTLVALCMSDTQGRGGDHEVYQKEAELLLTEISSAVKKLGEVGDFRKPLITGRDVLTYQIPAGKRIGAIMKRIEEMRDRGEIETREEALEKLKHIIEKEIKTTPPKETASME